MVRCSREYAAWRRGEAYGRYQYATEETVVLGPLPCWRHLSMKAVRSRVKDLLHDIEQEAAAGRRVTGKGVVGADAVMEMDPHHRPEKLDRSPAPDFHARRKKVRQAMRVAYSCVVTEYREAADRLRVGDRHARFPEGTFPPGRPFVPFPRSP